VKILVTGITKQQCGGGTALGYEPVSDLLVRGLRRSGNLVDHRYTVPEENLTDYDVVLVGLVPFFSINSSNLYAALQAIIDRSSRQEPIAFYVDDWRFSQMIANLSTHVRMPSQLVKPFFSGRLHHAWACENQPHLMEVVNRLHDAVWPTVILPTFTWGDHDRLTSILPSRDPHCVDLSAMAREYQVNAVDPSMRKHAWVLGTLSNQREWVDGLNLSWAVDYLGSRSARADEKVSEAELVQRYAESWGVLSAPYKQIVGTGWWRNRFIYAARHGAILLCDPREVPGLPAYHVRSQEIEEMSLNQLQELAQTQRWELMYRQPDEDSVADQLLTLMYRVRDGKPW